VSYELWFPELHEKRVRPELAARSLEVTRTVDGLIKTSFVVNIGGRWQRAVGIAWDSRDALLRACDHAEHLYQEVQGNESGV
jgi:hypothetical protein